MTDRPVAPLMKVAVLPARSEFGTACSRSQGPRLPLCPAPTTDLLDGRPCMWYQKFGEKFG